MDFISICFLLSVFCRCADVAEMDETMAPGGAELPLTSEIISPEHHPAAEYFVESLSSLHLNKSEVTCRAAF